VLAWALAERMLKGRASLLGAASGAIAGLVGITPAAGLVAPGASLVIGVLASWAAFYGVGSLKRRLGIDDAFDVFGIHAVGGIVGAILTGVFYCADLGGPGPAGLAALLHQTWLQVEAVLVSMAWAAISAVICAWLVDLLVGLRAAPDEERQGLDASEHGETAYPD